ncbi:polynucleotide kinase [Xanthomonas phage X1]|nr:polynucleotide kinase [Xanthomonas phage X1]
MKATLTIGVSASGKTTWALSQPGEVLSRDNYRWSIMEEKGISPSWTNWKWKWENLVTERVDADLALCAAQGKDIIIADTNLNENVRGAMAAKLEALGYTVEYKFFDVTWDEAVRRDNERAHGVGYSVLQKQHQQFLDNHVGRLAADADKGTRKAAIVDIDGTVALMEGVRGPFEWHKVHLDKPHTPIIDMVKGLMAAGYFILFTSGRSDECFDLTENWLQSVFAPDGYWHGDCRLLMREASDQRKDTIVKEEIYMRHIHYNYDVQIVLDDRPSVCRMWRDLGLNVVQVGNPYIEF